MQARCKGLENGISNDGPPPGGKAGAKDDVKVASKSIKKEIVAIAKRKKCSRVRKVLEEFKDLQRIAEIRGNGKGSCISSIIDRSGTERSEQPGVKYLKYSMTSSSHCTVAKVRHLTLASMVMRSSNP